MRTSKSTMFTRSILKIEDNKFVFDVMHSYKPFVT